MKSFEMPRDDMTPREIDEILSQAEPQMAVQSRRLEVAFDSQRDDDLGDDYSSTLVTRRSRLQTLRTLQTRDRRDQIDRLEAEIATLKPVVLKAHEIYRARGGWKRYFLVTNTGGHVHRGMHCSTCFRSTSYAWLPELSDCDEAAMVEVYGTKACTVCFPDAPAMPAWERAVKREEAAEREKAGSYCPGSGKGRKTGTELRYGYRSNRGYCQGCNGWVTFTQNLVARKHKLKG